MDAVSLFDVEGEPNPDIEVDARVLGLLDAGTPVCLSVSGGKDSAAAAHAVMTWLDENGYENPVSFWHADLGDDIEWGDSIRQCQMLADYYERGLYVVKSNAGTMIDGWRDRWQRNMARYERMEIRTLIKPWSGPGRQRFCTSGWKTVPIGRGLKVEYNKAPVINVVGIRREESAGRANTPTSRESDTSKFPKGSVDWFPIAGWMLDDVWNCLKQHPIPIHEAYQAGLSRVSCTMCVLASGRDLELSARFDGHLDTYHELVRLECESAYSFQGSRWLASVAPDLLTPELKDAYAEAQLRANARQHLESLLPDFNFKHGVPDRLLSPDEYEQVAEIRREVFVLYPRMQPALTNADEIRAVFEQRLAEAA